MAKGELMVLSARRSWIRIRKTQVWNIGRRTFLSLLVPIPGAAHIPPRAVAPEAALMVPGTTLPGEALPAVERSDVAAAVIFRIAKIVACLRRIAR